MREPSAQQRLDALARFDRIWIESLQREVQHARWETGALLRSVFSGELTILGKPVRIEFIWPEGPPYGMSNEEIARIASAAYPDQLPGASQ